MRETEAVSIPERTQSGLRILEHGPVLLAGIVLATIAAMLTVFAELVRSASWHMDEYVTLASYRHDGLRFLTDRIINWSPRPVSELILYAYAMCVARFGHPLSVWILGLLWGMFIASGFATAHWALVGKRWNQTILWRSLAGAALLAVFVVGRRPTEIFYWPEGAVAYLLALACLSLCFFGLSDGLARYRGGRIILVAALLMATLSVEIGAMFTACFAITLCALNVAKPGGAARWGRLAIAETGALLLTSLGVLGLLASHRVIDTHEFPTGNPALVHHAISSLFAAVGAWPPDAVALTGAGDWAGSPWLNLVLGIAGKVAFGIGFCWCWQQVGAPRPEPRAMAAFVAAAFGTSFLALAATYYQFGLLCCARHEEMREALVYFGIVGVAILLSGVARVSPGRAAAAVILLAAAIAMPFAAMVPALRHDERERNTIAAVTKANWRSGQASGPDMVFHLLPPEDLLPDSELSTGRYTAHDKDLPWTALGLLQFFRKQSVTVLAPARP